RHPSVHADRPPAGRDPDSELPAQSRAGAGARPTPGTRLSRGGLLGAGHFVRTAIRVLTEKWRVTSGEGRQLLVYLHSPLVLPLDHRPHALIASASVDAGGHGHILDGDAQRFEQRYVLRMFAASVAADDDLPQFTHIGPAQRAVFQRLLEVARLDARLVLAVHNDNGTAAH